MKLTNSKPKHAREEEKDKERKGEEEKDEEQKREEGKDEERKGEEGKVNVDKDEEVFDLTTNLNAGAQNLKDLLTIRGQVDVFKGLILRKSKGSTQ